jgi:hypothetical protein
MCDLPIQHLDAFLDVLPSLSWESNSELDHLEEKLVKCKKKKNEEERMAHVGGLLLIQLQSVALVLWDVENFNGAHFALLGELDGGDLAHAGNLVLLVEILGNRNLVVVAVLEKDIVRILRMQTMDLELGRLVTVLGWHMLLQNRNVLHRVQEAVHWRSVPIVLRSLEHLTEVLISADAAKLASHLEDRHGGKEGAVGDIDVDGEHRAAGGVDHAHGGEDTFEGLNTAAKERAGLSTSEEGFLDLSEHARWVFAQQVIEKRHALQHLGLPVGCSVEIGAKEIKLDNLGRANDDLELLLIRWLAALLSSKVDIDSLLGRKLRQRPEKSVSKVRSGRRIALTRQAYCRRRSRKDQAWT